MDVFYKKPVNYNSGVGGEETHETTIHPDSEKPSGEPAQTYTKWTPSQGHDLKPDHDDDSDNNQTTLFLLCLHWTMSANKPRPLTTPY